MSLGRCKGVTDVTKERIEEAREKNHKRYPENNLRMKDMFHIILDVQNETRNGLRELKQDIKIVRRDVEEVKSNVKTCQKDIKGMTSRLGVTEGTVNTLKWVIPTILSIISVAAVVLTVIIVYAPILLP